MGVGYQVTRYASPSVAYTAPAARSAATAAVVALYCALIASQLVSDVAFTVMTTAG